MPSSSGSKGIFLTIAVNLCHSKMQLPHYYCQLYTVLVCVFQRQLCCRLPVAGVLTRLAVTWILQFLLWNAPRCHYSRGWGRTVIADFPPVGVISQCIGGDPPVSNGANSQVRFQAVNTCISQDASVDKEMPPISEVFCLGNSNLNNPLETAV